MDNLRDVYAVLRRESKGAPLLPAGCCFVSMLLITACCCLINSPTVLAALPEGGDARRQMVTVFVPAAIGCLAFTLYGTGLFLRKRSRSLGLLLMLGATRRQLKGELLWELLAPAAVSCGLGMALGKPLASGLWQLLRQLIADAEERPLVFGGTTYLFPFLFFLCLSTAVFWMAVRSVERMDIRSIIRERHTAEEVRETPRRPGR